MIIVMKPEANEEQLQNVLARIGELGFQPHLSIIVDPSHATGQRPLIELVSRAAVAAGADGLIIEVHPDPEKALCDGLQSLPPEQFDTLMKLVDKVAEAVGRSL